MAGTATSAQVPVSAQVPASADNRTVVIVTRDGHPSLALLRAELEALNLDVREVAPDDPRIDSQYRVVLDEQRIEVWIRDPNTRRLTLREVFTQADGSPAERLTTVLHVVELLRIHLNTPPPIPHPLEPPPPPPSAPPTPTPRWALSAVPQLIYSPGGTTTGMGVQVDVMRQWSHVGVRGFATTALYPNQQVSLEGTAKAIPRFVGVQGVWATTGEESPRLGRLGAGVAIVSTRLTASGETGYRPRNDHLLTVSPLLDLRGGVLVRKNVALVATGTILVPLRSDRIVFGDREVAQYGAAMVTAGVGVEVRAR